MDDRPTPLEIKSPGQALIEAGRSKRTSEQIHHQQNIRLACLQEAVKCHELAGPMGARGRQGEIDAIAKRWSEWVICG